MRRACALLIAVLLYPTPPASAHPAPTARLHVAFSPARLGQHTAVDMSLNISVRAGTTPSPLTGIDLRYPSVLGFTNSGLGIATCPQATIELLSPRACPADSRLGRGSATVEIPFGSAIIRETATMAIIRLPEQNEHFSLLFYATGNAPVIARLAFPALLLPGPSPSQESVDLKLPLVQGLPDGPYASVIAMHATFGPRDLIYYESAHGRHVPYRPQGILLPNVCPRGGFAFSASLEFLDGSHSIVRDAVPCPKRR